MSWSPRTDRSCASSAARCSRGGTVSSRSAPVTAIVTTFNRANFLGEALDSILGQTVVPAQVIVVNDGSTDGTAEVLQRYGDRIEVIDQENAGKPTALNRALLQARGDHVWIFDDDDIALPENVERNLAALEADPAIGFAFSGCRIVDSYPDGRLVHRDALPIPDISDDEIFPRLLEENFLQQQSMLVRTRCYREVGSFDPAFSQGEDYEMNLRLARRFPGRGVGGESFLFRHHPGVRGQPGAQFAAVDRYRRWIDFNRILLQRLHGELGLAEYLPRGQAGAPLDEARRRHALLQRAAVMARCGLWELALPDFREALVGAPPGVPLQPVERDMCGRALSMYVRRYPAVEELIDRPELVERLQQLIEECGRAELRSAFGLEVVRYARRKLSHDRDRAQAARAFRLARRLGGMHGRFMDDAG